MKRFFRVIISLLLLIASVGVGIFFLWPRYQDLISIRRQVDEHRDRLERGEQALARLESVRQEVAMRQQEFEKIAVAVPEDPMVPALLDHVEQLASSSGLVLVSVAEQVPSPDETDTFQKILITLELQGSYEGFRNFLDAARRSSRIVTIDTVKVQAAQSAQQGSGLRVTIQLVAYAQLP